MKEELKKQRLKKTILWILLLLFCFDLGLILVEYENYQDKMTLASQVLSEQGNKESIVRILKGEEIKNSRGRNFLEEYGYYRLNGNVFYTIFLQHCGRILVLSLVILGILSLSIWGMYKRWEREELKEIASLKKFIDDLRNEEFYKNQLTYDSFLHKELAALYIEIDALGHTLEVLYGRLRKEKEETKAMVTDISHQLKTPIQALNVSFEILCQDNLTKEEREEFMHHFRVQLDGIGNLLDALINISRMETGMIHIQKEKKAIFDTVADAVNRVYEKAVKKGIMLELDAPDEIYDLFIPQDAKWLGEALINLLENAIKYSDDNTKIEIRIRKRVSFLRIEMEDEGIGIPKEEYNRIFQRFYRGNSPRVRKESGSGVGLYLTREIITKHNGTIRVSAGKYGSGTLFIIQLPYE